MNLGRVHLLEFKVFLAPKFKAFHPRNQKYLTDLNYREQKGKQAKMMLLLSEVPGGAGPWFVFFILSCVLESSVV